MSKYFFWAALLMFIISIGLVIESVMEVQRWTFTYVAEGPPMHAVQGLLAAVGLAFIGRILQAIIER